MVRLALVWLCTNICKIRKLSHDYIFRCLQHLAAKLRNFTNFKMLFSTVVKDFVPIAWIKIYSIMGINNWQWFISYPVEKLVWISNPAGNFVRIFVRKFQILCTPSCNVCFLFILRLSYFLPTCFVFKLWSTCFRSTDLFVSNSRSHTDTFMIMAVPGGVVQTFLQNSRRSQKSQLQFMKVWCKDKLVYMCIMINLLMYNLRVRSCNDVEIELLHLKFQVEEKR